jgi:hypothetical protein
MTTAQQFGFIGSTIVGESKREMDRRFRAAVLSAVANGAERCPTTPSTALGTRYPISGYERV